MLKTLGRSPMIRVPEARPTVCGSSCAPPTVLAPQARKAPLAMRLDLLTDFQAYLPDASAEDRWMFTQSLPYPISGLNSDRNVSPASACAEQNPNNGRTETPMSAVSSLAARLASSGSGGY
jgi:hypothetical protein